MNINGKKTIIQCIPDDQMKNIYEKFTEKVFILRYQFNLFLYSSNKVNSDLTCFQKANSADKIRNQINVLYIQMKIIKVRTIY